MTWTQWLADGKVKRHQTSKKELDSVRALIARDLSDASIQRLSADRRFATAYNAALQTAKMAILCAGYRVSAGAAHHKTSLECMRVAIGKPAEPYADYFDRCRRKRNVIDYDDAYVATETEAQEIVAKVQEFLDFVERWIEKVHPPLKA